MTVSTKASQFSPSAHAMAVSGSPLVFAWQIYSDYSQSASRTLIHNSPGYLCSLDSISDAHAPLGMNQ